MTYRHLCHAAVLGILVLALLALASGSAQAAPGDRARARLQESQQRIDQAAARIRDLVRDIANSGSAQATAELNKQLKSWEAERANAQLALVQAREHLRNLEAREAQFKTDVDGFILAMKQFVADMKRLQEEGSAHNQDAAAQRQAVQSFNNLPANQRSQAEADRLNFWRDVVNARRDRLQNRQGALERRRAELQRWESQILERTRQFENS